jgi:hypothetical protein
MLIAMPNTGVFGQQIAVETGVSRMFTRRESADELHLLVQLERGIIGKMDRVESWVKCVRNGAAISVARSMDKLKRKE